MDKLSNYLSAIEDVLATKSEKECCRNVFETLNGLKEEFPDKVSYIEEKFRELCVKYNKDFFYELTIDTNDLIHQCPDKISEEGPLHILRLRTFIIINFFNVIEYEMDIILLEQKWTN